MPRSTAHWNGARELITRLQQLFWVEQGTAVVALVPASILRTAQVTCPMPHAKCHERYGACKQWSLCSVLLVMLHLYSWKNTSLLSSALLAWLVWDTVSSATLQQQLRRTMEHGGLRPSILGRKPLQGSLATVALSSPHCSLQMTSPHDPPVAAGI